MRRTFKRSDVLEIITEIALRFGLAGAVLLAFGLLLWRYRGEGYTAGLIGVRVLAGAGLLGYAIHHAWKVRAVRLYVVRCPFCNEKIQLTCASDPAVQAGRLAVEVKAWMVEEGSFTRDPRP